jgi:glutathione peroxidase
MRVTSVFDIPILSVDGSVNVMDKIRGNVCLFTNIVTKTSYSPKCSPIWSYARAAKQLWELQKLHEMFADKSFSVVAFPCNQFGEMEPAENSDIAQFVSEAYPFVTFPITEKVEVNGPNEHQIWSFLKGDVIRAFDDNKADGSDRAADGQNLAGQAMMRIPHNYEKFMVSRDGQQDGRFNWADLPLADKPLAAGSSWTVVEAVKSLVG